MSKSTVTASPTIRAIAACTSSNVPAVVIGGPGQGKTATHEGALGSWGYHVETIVGSTREATDFLGVMIEKDGVINYSSFGWVQRLNDAERSVLLLDEFNTGRPSTIAAQLRLVQERMVGDTPLNDTVSIIALMNDPDDAVDGLDLPAPMANRFVHLDWVMDSRGWLDNLATGFTNMTMPAAHTILHTNPDQHYAVVASRIAGFLQSHPEHLNPGVPSDERQAGQAWASPRSWHNAAKAMAHLREDDNDALYLILSGAVGEGIAREYFAWITTEDLHDPFEVMDDPSIVKWSTERPDRLFVLMQSVSALATGEPKRYWRKAMDVMTACAQGGKPDAAAPGAMTLLTAMPVGESIPASFSAAFKGLMERTRYGVDFGQDAA